VDRTIRLLEKNGIFTDETADDFALRSPLDRVRGLVEQIRNSVYTKSREEVARHEENPTHTFNFIPSRSIRGETCGHWPCARSKLASLARYAALYADRLLLPLKVPPPGRIEDSVWSRDGVAFTIKEILLLRPLVESGIVTLVTPDFHFCEKCAEGAKAQVRMIDREVDALYQARRREFAASYTPMTGQIARLVAGYATLTGPANYLEHGTSVCVFHNTPAWVPPHRASTPTRLSRSTLEKSGLIRRVFKEMAWDVVFQQFYGVRFDGKYLTDLPGEAEFMHRISRGDEVVESTAALAAQLTHSIPLFAGVSVATILRIRREGSEPLILYRAALTQIVKDLLVKGERITPARAREIFRDILEPQLAKLKAEAAARRRSATRKAVVKVGIPALVVSVGVLGGFLPAAISELLKAVGGVAMATSIGEALASLEKNPAEVRSHNLYFLLRISQEAS
jgi:hypothetical protein